MQSGTGEGDRINSYALVSYIPGPLGSFLDGLRRDLVAGCVARSHVTVLPPRVLPGSPVNAAERLHQTLKRFPPFELELGNVELFESTSVVHIRVTKGAAELQALHDNLNSGELFFAEPYRFHPHVTLAQDFGPENVEAVLELARRRWSEFQSSRGYEVDLLAFVQNTAANRWLDLEEIHLGDPVGSARGSTER